MNLKELGLSEAKLKRIIAGPQPKPKVIKNYITDKTLTFGIVSDTHLCSKEEKLNELHTFYEICRKSGIQTVLHVGDVVAGNNIYRGQENEVTVFGADAQAQYVVRNYPKVHGIQTYFITGNHDLGYWVRSGIDIGRYIESRRPDMDYLGQYEGNIKLGHIRVRLLHPDSGGAYAISYKGQKIAEQIPSGNKPHILLLGHFHTSVYFFYRNIHVLQSGCFEGQTTFLLRKGINPAIGGWTVQLHLGSDPHNPILAFTPTWIPFFEKEGR